MMRISPARAIAFDILCRVESEGAYASDLLHAELGAPGDSGSAATKPGAKPGIKPEDAALATELTLGVLRWRRLLDFLLGPLLRKPVDRLDAAVAIALRVGLYQLRFLERIPASAAVNESVEMVKRAKKSSAAALVNAVLRKAAAQLPRSGSTAAGAAQKSTGHGRGFTSEKQLASLAPADRIATLHSHPTWLVERWLGRFGEERTIALLEANNRAPRLSVALHGASGPDEIAASLEREALDVKAGALLRNAFAVSGGSVVHTKAFREGMISIQDEASQIVPLLLDVRAGDSVLDLCAAPGGKTALLARATGPNGMVVAADIHAHRLRAMQAQFDRLRLERIKIIELDASKPLPLAERFMRILVDAPCSGTGTLARHPEICWRLRPGQIAEFHQLQVAILRSALGALAPGGRLVYSTCSLEPEENESVVREALGETSREPSDKIPGKPIGPEISVVKHGRAIGTLAPHVAPGVEAASLFDSEGFFRTLPGMHATDGFFAAILEKKSSEL